MDKFSWKQYEAELTKRGYKVHLQEKESGGVYGYSIKRGNSIYKSSVARYRTKPYPIKDRGYLGETPSAGEEVRTDKTYFPTNTDSRYYSYFTACDKALQYSDRRISQLPCEIPEAQDNIIRQNCSLEEAHPLAKLEEIQHTALLLFAGYLDAATSMATSSGGGSDTGGWGRDKDEDELEWARRCARMANSMCKRRKGLHR